MTKIPVATHYVSITTSQDDSNLLCLGNLNHGKLKEAVSAYLANVGLDHKLLPNTILVARSDLSVAVNALEEYGMTPVIDDVARCSTVDAVYVACGGTTVVGDKVNVFADNALLGTIEAEGMLIDEFLSLASSMQENINKITPFPVSRIVTASQDVAYCESSYLNNCFASLKELAQNHMMEFIPRSEEKNTIVSGATMAKTLSLRSQDGRKVTCKFVQPKDVLAALTGQNDFKYNLNVGDSFQGPALMLGGDSAQCKVVTANKKFVEFTIAGMAGKTKQFTLGRRTFEDIVEFCSMKKVAAFTLPQKMAIKRERAMEPKTLKQVKTELPVRPLTKISDGHMSSPDRKMLSPDHEITAIRVKPKDLW